MKFRSYVSLVVLAGTTMVSAQTAPLASSHKSTVKKTVANPTAVALPVASSKPAVRVNGAVLTETDVLREMYTIFPYAQQHNGFPKDMEPEIRKGATDMLIFEELLFQEAKRRKIEIPAERMAKSEAMFRKQFPTKSAFGEYLKADCNGSMATMREKIRRALLIDQMMRTEVLQKVTVTPADVKAYYDKNSKEFERPETFTFQTISIIPPQNANAAALKEAKAKITDVVRLGRAAKSSQEFGLLAEQISEDDWRTQLGNRGSVDVTKLPPPIVVAARKLKIGEVSEPIQLGSAWTVIRLNGHSPSRKVPFTEVKAKLRAQLQTQKKVEIRGALNQKLRQTAKIEIL